MPDGRHIIFTQRDQEGRAPVLWRIAIDGGKREKLGTLQLPRPPSLMRVHPDGTRIAFQVDTLEATAEVWVLENFLTKPDPGN